MTGHRRTPHDVNTADLLASKCTHCQAAVGAYCRYPSGEISPFQHAPRYRAAFELAKEMAT